MALLRRGQNYRVLLGGARPRRQLLFGRQHDLIDRDPVLAPLNQHLLPAAAWKPQQRAVLVHRAPAVVLPSPPRHAAVHAFLEIDWECGYRIASDVRSATACPI